jgi:hypothetical protein
MESVPLHVSLSELCFRLNEKLKRAVGITYLPPGEPLDPGNLVDLSDDADLEVW